MYHSYNIHTPVTELTQSTDQVHPLHRRSTHLCGPGPSTADRPTLSTADPPTCAVPVHPLHHRSTHLCGPGPADRLCSAIEAFSLLLFLLLGSGVLLSDLSTGAGDGPTELAGWEQRERECGVAAIVSSPESGDHHSAGSVRRTRHTVWVPVCWS